MKLFNRSKSSNLNDTDKKLWNMLKIRNGMLSNEYARLDAEYKKLFDKRLTIKTKLDNDTDTNIILNVKNHKDKDPRSFLAKIIDYVMNKDSREKISGHIFHWNKNMELSIFDITSDKADNLFKIKTSKGADEGEAYMLHEYFGKWHGRNVFQVKYPFAISFQLMQEKFDITQEGTEAVGLDKEPQLAYDAKAYYNILEHTTKRKLTQGEGGGLGGLAGIIKQYWPYILIIVVGGYLFLTPQGKAMLQSLLASFKVK